MGAMEKLTWDEIGKRLNGPIDTRTYHRYLKMRDRLDREIADNNRKEQEK